MNVIGGIMRGIRKGTIKAARIGAERGGMFGGLEYIPMTEEEAASLRARYGFADAPRGADILARWAAEDRKAEQAERAVRMEARRHMHIQAEQARGCFLEAARRYETARTCLFCDNEAERGADLCFICEMEEWSE